MKTLAVIAALASLSLPQRVAKPGPSADACVTIGKPKPGLVFTYEHVESTGAISKTTQQWESVTDTGSRVLLTIPAGRQIQDNVHRIVNDAMVLERQTKMDGRKRVISHTWFDPGLVADPGFRACPGRSWSIPSVTATFETNGKRHSASTPAGSLRILGIRERITVPAGTFETVNYVRTSQSRDTYWKSLEHGVIVKHIASFQGGTVTETLISIK